MIPKIIHYTWFSEDPFPPLIEKCIESWKRVMPDYEFVHWDKKRIEGIDNPFLREALSVRKWAFAADFTRLYALYNQGGIYLDTDVEVFKNFDHLLNAGAFIGRENSYHVAHKEMVSHLSSHCMGCEKGNSYIKACLDYYNDRHFILSKETWLPDNLKYDQKTLPYIQFEIAVMQGYKPSRKIKGEQVFGDEVHVYPYEYFDCHYQSVKSYCKHHAMGSWRGRNKKDKGHAPKDGIGLRIADMNFRLGGSMGFMIVRQDKRNLEN